MTGRPGTIPKRRFVKSVPNSGVQQGLSNFEHTGSKRERFAGPGIMEIDHRPDTQPFLPGLSVPPTLGPFLTMTQLRYKDYQGAVTFADGTLIIQILHIDDLITTEMRK